MISISFTCLVTFISAIVLTKCAPTRDEYLKIRENVIQMENSSKTGYKIHLSSDEVKVNGHLMQMKKKEYDLGRATNGIFPPKMHFFHAKEYIDKSPVFDFIKKMPKGAALHLHDQAVASMNFLIKEATYDPNCYMCYDKEGILNYHFYEHPPKNPDCEWKQVDMLRNQSDDPKAFDLRLFKEMTLVVDNPEEAYPTIDAVWERFLQLFRTGYGLVFHAPIFRKFYYQTLTEFYEDNVQYVELRGNLPLVYELDGSTHDKFWSVGTYESVTKQFLKDHSDFAGAKFIYTTARVVKPDAVLDAVKDAVAMEQKYPSFFAGYDLVGQEDPGKSLLYYLDPLLYPAQNGLDLKYFFHAGETSWKDVATDINILDALLLNTSRIGHGYAITKHPQAMKMAREKDVPIEVNPISNQVLKLVDNLQNHPATELMSSGFPLVISSDDPTFWNAKGLSYDFYEAFMALGGAWADLSTLKQLAMDSIKYSAMDKDEKQNAFKLWGDKWNTFVQQIIRENKL